MPTDPAAPADFVMPFGKWKGRPLVDVPAKYLVWVLENVEALYPETRAAIEAYIGRPVSVAGDGQAAPPTRRRRAPADREAEDAGVRCSVCGLAGTHDRPLVHARCVDNELLF